MIAQWNSLREWEKTNHKPQWDYHLFPKQSLNKHLTEVEMPKVQSEIMCLLSQGKWKMWTWRCLISWLTKPGCYQQGHAVWILLPLVNWSFYTTVFLERTLRIFHWLSTTQRGRCGAVGAASFFWRGREKIVLHTLEEGNSWVLMMCKKKFPHGNWSKFLTLTKFFSVVLCGNKCCLLSLGSLFRPII